MQQQKHSGRLLTGRPALLALLGAAALLALLIVTGWGSARAAPQSGGPSLSIVSFDGNTLTLQFDGWTLHEIIRLRYSPKNDCSASQALPNNTFSAEATSFRVNYTWPSSGINPGVYYLCATASEEGIIASQQPITIDSNGIVQPTPATPGSTPTSASGSPTSTAASSPVASASATPGANRTPDSSGPGNQGASATSSNGGSSTLIAIILLCLLVMALLAYLIRLWLQGRQPAGQPPASGGQQGP
ncbi:MAG TPA: hypothetical protein VH599_18555 [Ktedonobacterales bacterium]|jgi:hypothetical protein